MVTNPSFALARAARTLIVLLILGVCGAVSLAGAASPAATSAPVAIPVVANAYTPVPASFVGFVDGNRFPTADGTAAGSPLIGFGLQRIPAPWYVVQPTADGSFRFNAADISVGWDQQHGMRTIVALGETPLWASSDPTQLTKGGGGSTAPPTSDDAYRAYITAVVQHFAGRVVGYEIWNEANHRGYFTGTPQRLAELSVIASTTIHQLDPGALVMQPSLAGLSAHSHDKVAAWLGAYLDAPAFGGNPRRYLDTDDVHVYAGPRAPEEIASDVSFVRSVAAQHRFGAAPMYMTETGWGATPGSPIDSLMSAAQRRAWAARAYLVAAGSKLQSMVWFGVEPEDATSIDLLAPGPHGTLGVRAGGQGVQAVVPWLTGASAGFCRVGSGARAGVWACPLHYDTLTLSGTTYHNVNAAAVWTVEGTAQTSAVLPSGTLGVAFLGGPVRVASAGQLVQLTATPRLVITQG